MKRIELYVNNLDDALSDFEDYCGYAQWNVTTICIADFVDWLNTEVQTTTGQV